MHSEIVIEDTTILAPKKQYPISAGLFVVTTPWSASSQMFKVTGPFIRH